jgi:hypothetical protein
MQNRARSHAVSKGISFTPTRQRVLALLAATGKPMAAYEIAEKVSGSRKVQAVQVYRALEFLQKAACVRRLASRSGFFACDHRHGEGETVVFMVCSQSVWRSRKPPRNWSHVACGAQRKRLASGHDIRRLRWRASVLNARVYRRFDALVRYGDVRDRCPDGVRICPMRKADRNAVTLYRDMCRLPARLTSDLRLSVGNPLRSQDRGA